MPKPHPVSDTDSFVESYSRIANMSDNTPYVYLLLFALFVSTIPSNSLLYSESVEETTRIIGGYTETCFKRELKRKLLLHEVMPKVIPSAQIPHHLANVTWDTGVSAAMGNVIHIEKIQKPPRVGYPYNESLYYSIIMTDYDDEKNWEPSMEQWHLWFVANIPGNRIEKGEVILPYIPPEMPDGPHRINILVMEHTEYIDMNYIGLDKPPRYYFSVAEAWYAMEGCFKAINMFVATPPPP